MSQISIEKLFNVEINGKQWLSATKITNDSDHDLSNLVVAELVQKRWILPGLGGLAVSGGGLKTSSRIETTHPDRNRLGPLAGWDDWCWCWITGSGRPERQLASKQTVLYGIRPTNLCGTERFSASLHANELQNPISSAPVDLPSGISDAIDHDQLIDLDGADHKLEAAQYHLDVMQNSFSKAWFKPEAPDGIHAVPGPIEEFATPNVELFFTHFEAFLFQIYAAWDFVLQELVVRRRLGIAIDNVTWPRITRLIPDDPVMEYMAEAKTEEWFLVIQEIRNTMAHRRRLRYEVLIETGGRTGGVSVLSGSVMLPGICLNWIDGTRYVVNEAIKLLRGTGR